MWADLAEAEWVRPVLHHAVRGAAGARARREAGVGFQGRRQLSKLGAR